MEKGKGEQELIKKPELTGFNPVPKAGLEPARGLPHCPLKTACLPVPPLRLKIIPHPDQVTVAHLAERFLFQAK